MDALFPVLPVDILASRGVDRRGEKWEGMEFKVGQLFICPLFNDLFSVDAFSTVPLLTFPLSLHCAPHHCPRNNPVIFSLLLSTILLPSHPSSKP